MKKNMQRQSMFSYPIPLHQLQTVFPYCDFFHEKSYLLIHVVWYTDFGTEASTWTLYFHMLGTYLNSKILVSSATCDTEGINKMKRPQALTRVNDSQHTVIYRMDGRLGSRLRGYHPVAPRPISCRPCTAFVVPSIVSRCALCQATWEISVNEGQNYGWEMKGSLTCHKSVTWLFFPSEGRHAEDFFALKKPTVSAGFEPAILGTRGRHANH
jgi:hypothetical protein